MPNLPPAFPVGSAAPAGTALRVRWAFYDFAVSAYATLIQTFIFAAYFTRQLAPDAVTGTAWWGYATALAGALVAVGAPLAGALADSRGGHMQALRACTLIAVVATAALWFARPGSALAPVVLALVAGTVAVELASVFYNALLSRVAPPERIGRWSGWGWALGYAGGLGCLVAALYGLVRPQWPTAADDAHVRATFLLAAAWIAVFALPLLTARGLATPGTGAGVRDGLRTLVRTVRELARLPGMLRFLAARMLYTDALTTVFAFGGVYAAGTFGMDAGQVLMLGIVLNISAGAGALVLAPLDDRFGSRATIVAALAVLLVVGTVLLVVRTQTQFLIAAAVLGALVGPVQSASRSLMTHLSPPPLRTQLFGLYAFSGKATAFAGPLLVGLITGWTGSQRLGLASTLVLLGAGLWLVRGVPAARAHTTD